MVVLFIQALSKVSHCLNVCVCVCRNPKIATLSCSTVPLLQQVAGLCGLVMFCSPAAHTQGRCPAGVPLLLLHTELWHFGSLSGHP